MWMVGSKSLIKQEANLSSKCPTSYTDAAVSMGKYCYQKGRSLLVSVEQFYLFRSIQIHDADGWAGTTYTTDLKNIWSSYQQRPLNNSQLDR